MIPTASPNLDQARSRLLRSTRRFIEGARLQRERVLERSATAPRLLEGSPHEVIDLTGQPSTDLDYYTYEMARLQDTARTVMHIFNSPVAVAKALKDFDAAIPHLRSVRNPLTHASDDARLDHIAWFSSIVRLRPDGSVENLIDPRYEHHEVTEQLAESLLAYLRAGLRAR